MKRLQLLVLTSGIAIALLAASPGAAHAAPPGRSASVAGLAQAAVMTMEEEFATEQISLNFAAALDPTQPGVAPGGGGGVEP